MILFQHGSDQLALVMGHEIVQRPTPGSGSVFTFFETSFKLEVREAGSLDFFGSFQNDGPLDHIAQLADVAGPMMRDESLLGHFGKALNRAIHAQREMF